MDQTEADGESTPDNVSDPESVDPVTTLDSAAKALESLEEPGAEEVPRVVEMSERFEGPTSSIAGDYSRAVLSIATPVAVVLARKNVALDQIVNLVPGSMLTFEAHCDEPLTLEAGGHPIAKGESVKIGDKFGLRIRQILSDSEDDYWTHR